MTNARLRKHVSIENVKIHVFMNGAERMPSARWTDTYPNVHVYQAIEETLTNFVELLNA